MSPEAEKIYEILSARPGEWVRENLIQKTFRKQFGYISYRDAMNEVRSAYGVEHRYEIAEKKQWVYRLTTSAQS